MPQDYIFVKGAREHNLKNVDVTIPRDKLVVITGVSGSGKSSLAFDTIYAEGQRKYVESLSAYARQFLGQMEKPDVDHIEGLSPAISIDQKGVSHNPRSTVGTVTEIYDYLRLLFARIGRPHCPTCGLEITRQSVQQIVDSIFALPKGKKLMIMATMIRDRKGEYQAIFEDLRKQGYSRVRVDGKVRGLDEEFKLDKNKKHTIEVVVDRLILGQAPEDGESTPENRETTPPSASELGRVADSVETALKLGGGTIVVSIEGGEEILYSENFACVKCGFSLAEMAPRNFSFNSPHGACPECTGLGFKLDIDPELVMPNKSLTLEDGAVRPWSRENVMSSWYYNSMRSLAYRRGFSMNTPVKDLTKEQTYLILYGENGGWDSFEGVIPNLERRFKQTESDYIRTEIERYMRFSPCPSCKGKRLKPEYLAVTVIEENVMDVCAMSIVEAMEWVDSLSGGGRGQPLLSQREILISNQILKEILSRLGFLRDVGLEYLTVDRASQTLSGGESQRIRLATQIGSGLMGVLYICDEPTVGLHPADDFRLIRTLQKLRDLGNTIIIVEHDEAMMRAADYIIDMGPGAGKNGGYVVAVGTLEEILRNPDSITGKYLSGALEIPLSRERHAGSGKSLVIKGARENNLKNIDVKIPLGQFVCITGVSGSGKSTLINEILYKKLAQVLYQARERPGEHDAINGIENVDKVINIDQSPIGRTPRSNPATYTGTFTPVRELFATSPDAKMRGYGPGRFSFNVKGGRCEACHGAGFLEIEMQFLPSVTVPCDVCKGKRYNREALEIHFKGKNISEVLDMTVDEALEFFENLPSVRAKLRTLSDVGLGYVQLGQPATTLSGGEAQRVKLATELSRRSTGRTLYLLDEPTTGLAFSDVNCLLKVLLRLVDAGNTVVIIEHHLDIVKNSDWVIDLGPGAGGEGGRLVDEGTPEKIARREDSLTGQYLKKILEKHHFGKS